MIATHRKKHPSRRIWQYIYRGVYRGKRRKKQNAHAIGVVVVEKGRVAAHTCVVNKGGCVRVM